MSIFTNLIASNSNWWYTVCFSILTSLEWISSDQYPVQEASSQDPFFANSALFLVLTYATKSYIFIDAISAIMTGVVEMIPHYSSMSYLSWSCALSASTFPPGRMTSLVSNYAIILRPLISITAALTFIYQLKKGIIIKWTLLECLKRDRVCLWDLWADRDLKL